MRKLLSKNLIDEIVRGTYIDPRYIDEDKLNNLMENLNDIYPLDVYIVKERCKINHPRSFSDIAEEMGVSFQRVQKRFVDMITRLRKPELQEKYIKIPPNDFWELRKAIDEILNPKDPDEFVRIRISELDDLHMKNKILEERFNVISRNTRKEYELDTPIETLNFSKRVFHCLKRENVDTLQDLLCLDYWDLMSIQNFGKGCFKEVREKLASFGYILEEKDKHEKQEEEE